MPRQTSIQLTEVSERQSTYLKQIGFGTFTDIVRIAIERMAQTEGFSMNSKTFRSIDLSSFEGFQFSDDVDPMHAPWHSDVAPGLEFYAVNVFFENNGQERTDGRPEPARKNMSGEICIDGWCGTTNNVNVTAMGQWRITHVNASRGNGRYDIDAVRIQ